MIIQKNSMAKDILLTGLDGQGFTCAKRTNCVTTPIYLYYNRSSERIAIFRCGITEDELIITDFNKQAKIKIIIDEYKTFKDNCRDEIAEILGKIISGAYFEENHEVTFL